MEVSAFLERNVLISIAEWAISTCPNFGSNKYPKVWDILDSHCIESQISMQIFYRVIFINYSLQAHLYTLHSRDLCCNYSSDKFVFLWNHFNKLLFSQKKKQRDSNHKYHLLSRDLYIIGTLWKVPHIALKVCKPHTALICLLDYN